MTRHAKMRSSFVPNGRKTINIGALDGVDQHLGRGQAVRLDRNHEPVQMRVGRVDLTGTEAQLCQPGMGAGTSLGMGECVCEIHRKCPHRERVKIGISALGAIKAAPFPERVLAAHFGIDSNARAPAFARRGPSQPGTAAPMVDPTDGLADVSDAGIVEADTEVNQPISATKRRRLGSRPLEHA